MSKSTTPPPPSPTPPNDAKTTRHAAASLVRVEPKYPARARTRTHAERPPRETEKNSLASICIATQNVFIQTYPSVPTRNDTRDACERGTFLFCALTRARPARARCSSDDDDDDDDNAAAAAAAARTTEPAERSNASVTRRHTNGEEPHGHQKMGGFEAHQPQPRRHTRRAHTRRPDASATPATPATLRATRTCHHQTTTTTRPPRVHRCQCPPSWSRALPLVDHAHAHTCAAGAAHGRTRRHRFARLPAC